MEHIQDEKLIVPTYDFKVSVKGVYKFQNNLISTIEIEDINAIYWVHRFYKELIIDYGNYGYQIKLRE